MITVIFIQQTRRYDWQAGNITNFVCNRMRERIPEKNNINFIEFLFDHITILVISDLRGTMPANMFI